MKDNKKIIMTELAGIRDWIQGKGLDYRKSNMVHHSI